MFRILNVDKDTYITNKFIDNVSAKKGNVGTAGTLDLFKLYGVTQVFSGSTLIPQTELSRILIHFNLNPLRSLINTSRIDMSHPSFKCQIKIKDVYGGQTTPDNFAINVFPLSASFDEGQGRDTTYYIDNDKANFLSSSKTTPWFGEGCSLKCFSTGSGDYITSSITIADTKVSQNFISGEEDLIVDVTQIISATLTNKLPDSGFRISFSDTIETDQFTYFVKRFASRHAYDESQHPKMLVMFDDSISDDTSNLYLDSPISSSLFLYNYVNGQLTNLLSASSSVTGQNCLLLKLQTEVSGIGTYSLYFTGSQHHYGKIPATGIYSASISLPLSNTNLKTCYNQSGSIKFTPIWYSLDNTISYITGSSILARGPERINKRLSPRRYTIGITGINSEYSEVEEVILRVNIFDENSPMIIAKRIPIKLSGIVLKNVYYAVRNSVTNEYIIPFDNITNSSKLSSDAEGMYFAFNTSALTPLRTYVIDIMIDIDGTQQKYLNVSPVFKIIKI